MTTPPKIFALLFMLATAAVAQAQEPEVLVELERPRIFEGESVRYQVTINHVEDPEPPLLEGFDDFEVTPRGSHSLNSRSVTIINGQRSEVVRLGRVFSYQLTPKKTGTLTIPAPQARVAGQVITGREFTLEVTPPGEQDLVQLEISTDRQEVYPLQPFLVTLTIRVKALPEPHAQRNPMTVQRVAPSLEIPWVLDDTLPKGVRPEVSWTRWLQPLRVEQGGFSINNVTSHSVFSLFDDRLTSFMPAFERVQRADKSGKQNEYWEFTLQRTFMGDRVGRFEFGPVILKGRFAGGLATGNRLVGEDVYVIAAPIEVQVKDVPAAGRPDSYVGAVGQFEVAGKLTPTQAKVGDPLTFTLEIAGEGTLDAITPPQLDRLPEVAEHFRVYEATSATQGKVRRFTYSLRPLDTQPKEFPPIPVSYFDVDRESYVTLHTEPIPLTIGEAERLTDDDIAIATAPAADGASQEARPEGLYANVDDVSALVDQSIHPRAWFTGVAAMAGLYLALVLGVWRARQHAGNEAQLRRRRARQAASEHLQTAQAEIAGENWRGAADHLRQAVTGLVAHAAQLSHAGLTTQEVIAELRELEVPEALIERARQLLEACDGARYGGSADSLRTLADDAGTLVDRLSHEFRERKRL